MGLHGGCHAGPGGARERCAAIRSHDLAGYDVTDTEGIGHVGYRAVKLTPLMRYEHAYCQQGRVCIGVIQEAPFNADPAAQAATMEMFVRLVEVKARELAG